MILPLLLVGAVGGVLSGMFGVGGGVIMVPLLMLLARMDQRRASATSLVAIAPSALVGTIGYGLQGEIAWLAGALIAVGAVVGAPLGSRLLRALPIVWLRWLFIGFLVLVAARMILVEASRFGEFELSVGSAFGLVALGLFMGVASGLFGIGGGVIAVPVLIALFGFGDLLAKGTSLLAMIPTALSGSIANARAGLVSVRDGLIVGIAASVASFGGVALAFIIPPQLAGVLFGLLLLLIVVLLSVRAIGAQRAAKRERDARDDDGRGDGTADPAA